MHQEVYIDIVFAANLLMDYILLRLTGIVLRRKNSRRRCLAAAAVGALFACLNLYVRPGKTGVLTIVLRVVCAVFMIWIAYEIQDVKHMTGAALFFFGMTFLTGGFWMAVSENRRVTAVFFLSCAAVTYGGLSLMICLMEQIKESREHIYPVALKYHGQLQETYGLYDTGNRLCDTVTGAPVSVADPEILRSLLSEELTDRLLHLKERPEEIESTEIADLKPHYLSFQTVGREVQLILAVTLEDLCIQIPGERIHVSGPVFALSSEPFALGMEDLISIGTIGLIKAINTFNPVKNIKLATYASRCIENEILMYLRRNSKTRMEVSIDEPLNVDWDGNELLLSDILGTDDDVISRKLEDEVEITLLGKAINKLSPREQTIIRLRFGLNNADGKEKTQKEVADLLGISQSYISRLEKRIMKRLKKEIVKYE